MAGVILSACLYKQPSLSIFVKMRNCGALISDVPLQFASYEMWIVSLQTIFSEINYSIYTKSKISPLSSLYSRCICTNYNG